MDGRNLEDSNSRRSANECDYNDIVVIHEVPATIPANGRLNSTTEQYFLRNTEAEYSMVRNTPLARQNPQILVPNTVSAAPLIQPYNQFRYNQNASVQTIAATPLYQQQSQFLYNPNNLPIQNTLLTPLSWLQNQLVYQNFSAATAPYRQQQQQQNLHNQNYPVQNTGATAIYGPQKHFLYNRPITNTSTTNNFSFPHNCNQIAPVQNTPSTPFYHQPNHIFNHYQNVQLPNTPSTSQQHYHCLFPCTNHNQNAPVQSIPNPTTLLYEQQSPILSSYPFTSSKTAGPSCNISTPITPTTTPLSKRTQREALYQPDILHEIEKYRRRPREQTHRRDLNALIGKIQPLLNGVVVHNIKSKLLNMMSRKKKKLMKEREQHQTDNISADIVVTEEEQQMQNQQQIPFTSTEKFAEKIDIISREAEPVVNRAYSMSEEENLLNNCNNLVPGRNEQIRDVNDIDKRADGGILTKGNRLEIGYKENGRIDGRADLERPPTALYLDEEEQSGGKNLDALVEQKIILPTEKLGRENTIVNQVDERLQLNREVNDMPQPMTNANHIFLQTARRSKPFSHVVQTNLGLRRRFRRVPPICEPMSSFIKIDPAWLKIKLDYQHVGDPEHFIKQELLEKIREKTDIVAEEQQRPYQVKQEERSEFDAESLEAIKEALIHHPPPLCKIPKMPKVRVVCREIRKKTKKEPIKKLRISPSPCTRSIQCDECHKKRELSRSAYPLHMLANHCIFIDINEPILDHLRTLSEKSFRAIVWRCVLCQKDFGKIHEFDRHCKSESHLSMKAPSRKKKYTLDHVLSICKEKNFMQH